MANVFYSGIIIGYLILLSSRVNINYTPYLTKMFLFGKYVLVCKYIIY